MSESAPKPPAPEDGAKRLLLLGEVALEVAHELRNVLLVIDGSTYLAKKDPPASGQHLDKIERSVRLARAVVDDVFLLVRDEPLPREECTLHEIVEMARAEVEEADVDWVDAFDGVRLRAHDRLLARLFKILYENAIQLRAPQRARIETRAAQNGAGLVIQVEDDGPGVAPAIARHLFEPLVTSRPGGTGMGLPLARRIAVAHGGSIALGPSKGTGACFELRLPTA